MTSDAEEQAYIRGHRAACVATLRHALRELLGSEQSCTEQQVARLQAERTETMAALRELAKALEIDATWPEELHMEDVVRKRIGRALELDV
jgi:hypothetical protein